MADAGRHADQRLTGQPTDDRGQRASMSATTTTVSAAAIRSQGANRRCSPATPGVGNQVHARAEDADRCQGLQGDRQVGGARGNHRDQVGGSGSGPATTVPPRSSITAPGSDSRQAARCSGARRVARTARSGWAAESWRKMDTSSPDVLPVPNTTSGSPIRAARPTSTRGEAEVNRRAGRRRATILLVSGPVCNYSLMGDGMSAGNLAHSQSMAEALVGRFPAGHRIYVAFSGGADSALVLAAAARAAGPGQVTAVTAVSPSLSAGEVELATAFSAALKIDHRVLATGEMRVEGYLANSRSRCYFCKATLLDEVLALVGAERRILIATGTNADDVRDRNRPGIATAERGVRTPLADVGLMKTDVRAVSKLWGLATRDKPAMPCLSSRIAYGIRITQPLHRVDEAERSIRDLLRQSGLLSRDLRVRDLGDRVRVEVDVDILARVRRLDVGDVIVGCWTGWVFAAADPPSRRSPRARSTAMELRGADIGVVRSPPAPGGLPLPSPDQILVRLAYGDTGLDVLFPADRTTVVAPSFRVGVPDPRQELARALRDPVAGPPLRARVRRGQAVAIAICDVTRPQPRQQMVEAILAELDGVAALQDIVILVATGTHRGNTDAEIRAMLGEEIPRTIRVVNHDARDHTTLTWCGRFGEDVPVWLNSEWVNADVRIATGFVEPHFFAGFSGGPKLAAPGLAALDTVLELHNARRIGHPMARWGVCEGNPVHDDVRAITAGTGVHFSFDVILNSDKQIVQAFGGDLLAAHAAARAVSRELSMRPVDDLFDIVVTTNSGYPLDQNLYQAVKGMSAAAEVVKPGGTIICAAECRDGFPDHGSYREVLASADSPQALLDAITSRPETIPDQWQVQIQAKVQSKAWVGVHSSFLAPHDLRSAHFGPVPDISELVAERLAGLGPQARVCVLPEGPQTIPYLATP